MNNPHEKSSNDGVIKWLIIGLVLVVIAAIVLPNLIYTCSTTHAGYACINNLRQIDAAAYQFALVNNKTNGDVIRYPDDLTPYIKLNSAGKIPTCPGGGIYHLSKVGEVPTCTLSNTPGHTLP